MRSLNFIIILAAGLLLAGCHQDVLYVENQPVPQGVWSQGHFLKFDVPVTDTQQLYTIYLQVRNDGRYEYSNLWLFITTSSPTGAVMQDTVECVLAAPDGRWLGRGSGGRFSLEIPYRYQVRFPYEGVYSFEIQHGMRTKELLHVADIGIRIQKAF
ncbi:MAG: gliding motility lipoprotein GldH [Bacteroidales bacterium]|nr:gliding motility lipoprotein GldH [Bacteroidales bacterium]